MNAFLKYKKIKEEVFSLHQDLTLKNIVFFNQDINLKNEKTFTQALHNEFIVGDTITTNIIYHYQLLLSPRGFFKYGVTLNWDMYCDFLDFLDQLVFLNDPRNKTSPFTIIKDEFGTTINIKCDNSICQDLFFKDQFGKTVEAKPIILEGYSRAQLDIGIRLIFGEQPDLSYNIPLNRIRGFRKFLDTYNPLLHASNMINYLVSTPLIGMNQKKV